MKRSHWALGITALAGMAILILDSNTAFTGAQQGIDLCLRTVIPSLFPFFVLSILLTSTLSGVNFALLRPLGSLFNLPKGFESILIPGFLGGYPAGAQSIGYSLQINNITINSAQRLLLYCNNAGPAFIFGILGSVFPEKWMVWALWGICLLSSLLCARMLPNDQTRAVAIPRETISLSKAMNQAIRTMATVCGWIVLFRIIIAFLQRWFLWLLPAPLQVLIIGILEISNGCCELLSITDVRLRFLICSGLLSFGGLCVTMQTASVIGELSILPYLGGKILQVCFSLIISSAIMYHSCRFLLIFLPILWLILKKAVDFTILMLYNGSINLRRTPYAVSKKNGTFLRVLSPRHSA